MSLKSYKISSPKAAGHLHVTYAKGLLKEVKLSFRKLLTPLQFARWKDALIYKEADLPSLEALHLKVEPVAEKPRNKALGDKVALFCKYYNKNHTETYRQFF